MRFSVTLKNCLLLAAVFISGLAQATNFYVDASTTASLQNGSLANPWKTLAQVNSNMGLFNAGDFISFKRGGTYAGGQLSVTRSGTAGNPITFNAYGTGADPIFSGTGSTINSLFYVNNRSYITFQNLHITDPSLSWTNRAQMAKIQRVFYVDGSSNNIVIKGCRLSLIGVGAYFVGPNNTIDSCVMENLRMVVNTNDGGYDDYGANPVVISSSNNKITRNRFTGCWADSYDFTYDGGAIEFFGPGTSNNFIAYNTMDDNNGCVEFGSSNGGTSTGNIFAYNKLINNASLFYIHNTGPFAITVSNLQFYNNVIIETSTPRLFYNYLTSMATTTTASNVVISKNNIYWLTTGVDVARSNQFTGAQLDHTNNIYRMGTGSITNFTINANELTTTANNIFTNTSSSNPTEWNLIPPTGSPAIDFGTDVNIDYDFNGNPVPVVPNSGVYENVAAGVLSATATAGTILCNGGTTTITVSGSGGTVPYSGTGTFTVSAGTYTYTVADAAGLTKNVTITVNQPSAIAVVVATGTITVQGGTTTAAITASGGTGASYTYSLNGGAYQASNSFANVPAGNHSVNVKDANGCITNKTFVVTEPAVAPLAASAVGGSIICNGGTTDVTVTASGGQPPYTGTGTFTVSAGVHTYTITDANSVTQTATVTVSEPSAVSFTATAGTIAVYGGTTNITIAANGGTGTHTYRLNNGAYQASNVFTGVTAGTYAIRVKDANGCVKVQNVTVTQPALSPLGASATGGTILCNGGTTTVSVSATGGLAPYTGTGSFTVSAGTHTFTVTDAVGTTQTTTINVTEPTVLVANATASNIIVFGGTTTVNASASGGTAGYTYRLNNGSYQSSPTFANVAAGNHVVRVKDSNGCISSKNITVTQPATALAANAVAGPAIACNGGTTSITVTGNGGTSPYTGTGTFTVSAGTHTYTITDANGVTTTTSVTVSQPTLLVANATAGTITVNGGTTAVTASATGGTAGYTYKLNNGAYQTAATFANVAAGNYTVTVRDANGCTSTKNITITQPAANPMVASAQANGTIMCNGGNTTVNVTATGGQAPYSGTGTFTAMAGTNNYIVRDANGVTQTVTIVLTQPTAINVSSTIQGEVTSYGGSTNVNVTASGGTPGYSYSLNGGPVQNSPLFRRVPVGNHSVTITDANGCTKVHTFSVIQSETAGFRVLLVEKRDLTCIGSNDGVIKVVATGGRAPYTYRIGDNGRYGINPSFYNLAEGVYRVYAKDANNNVASIVVVLTDGERSCGRSNTLSIVTYPNPSAREFSLLLNTDTREDALVEVMDMFGRKLFVQKGTYDKKYQFGTNFRPGTYFVKVTQGDKVITAQIIKL